MARKAPKQASIPRSIARYGWTPDIPDHRDFLYSAPLARLQALPPKADLRPKCPPVYDQGQLGSCTGNSIAGAVQFDRMKQGLTPNFTPSRLFIYYNERVIEGTVSQDAGAMIRDGIKSVGDTGACPETDWPYDITKFAQKPPDQAYADAKLDRAVQYQRVPRAASQMKGCLADGYPFVFGFSVYESFESPAVAKSGHAPMPGPKEQQIGGHAVMAVGYSDADSWFIVRNSWGNKWGMKGYFTLPYGYLLDENLSDDFWTIRLLGA